MEKNQLIKVYWRDSSGELALLKDENAAISPNNNGGTVGHFLCYTEEDLILSPTVMECGLRDRITIPRGSIQRIVECYERVQS